MNNADNPAYTYRGNIRPGNVCDNDDLHCAFRNGEQGWCDDNGKWDENCCFSQNEPDDTLQCKEYSECYYECCPIDSIICGQDNGKRMCCNSNEQCINAICKNSSMPLNVNHGKSKLAIIIPVTIIGIILCFIGTFFVTRRIIDRWQYTPIADAENVKFIAIDPDQQPDEGQIQRDDTDHSDR